MLGLYSSTINLMTKNHPQTLSPIVQHFLVFNFVIFLSTIEVNQLKPILLEGEAA
jgi:hypothetical protein